MTSFRLAALALSLSALPALAAEGHFERTLSVSPSLKLSVATGAGNVRVTPGSDSQLHISAHIRASMGWLSGFGGDIESRIHQIESNPPIQQSGNTVTIGKQQNDSLFQNLSIDYDIQAPRGATLFAMTGSGDIQSEDPGNASAFHTGSGSIRVNNLRGAASLHAGSGDIQLQQASAGNVEAQTGSGSIRINGFTGGLSARTGSGDIQVEGHPAADWQLRTGSGSIRLGLGQSPHATIEASTGSGDARISQPTSSLTNDQHHLHATLNGGGPTIHATTGSGDVEIH